MTKKWKMILIPFLTLFILFLLDGIISAYFGSQLSMGQAEIFQRLLFIGLYYFTFRLSVKHMMYLSLFFGVTIFILCGFEHCVADMFYFTLARVWSADVLLRTLVITLGNGVGAVLLPLLKKFMDRTEAA